MGDGREPVPAPFFRGLAFGLLLSAPVWALGVWAVIRHT